MSSRLRRRVLVISYHFPPAPGVASMRLANLVRHLPAFGWDVDVLAGPAGSHPDESLARATSPPSLVRVEPLRRAPGLAGADWAAAALPAAHRLARAADVVLISGGPFAPFLLGRLLGRPYVLDFRDPWSWEPRFGRLARRPRRRIGASLERRAEASAVRRASGVVTVAPEIADVYRRLYPAIADRIEIVRHGFEPADFTGPEPPKSEYPQLVYAGTFVPEERTPELLVETARRVRDLGTPLRVRLLGSLPSELRSLTEGAEQEGWLEVAGLVPHFAAVSAARSAGVLWVQPGDIPFVVTGKICEYLGAGPPIVAVAPAEGALASLLAATGGAILVQESVPDCADAVLAALAGEAPPRIEEAVAALAAPRIAERLAAVLERATSR